MPHVLEKHGSTVMALGVMIAGFAARQRINARFFQPVSQRLDAQHQRMNERFEPIHQRLDRLTDGVFEPRRLMVSVSERVARNEGEIDVIREHLPVAATPSP